MNAAAFLADLAARGVTLTVVGDRLRFAAPRGVLTAGDRDLLAQHKTALLVLVEDVEEPADPAPTVEEPSVEDVEEWCRHLALLWPPIAQGCAAGLQQHTTGVPSSKVQDLIDAACPARTSEEAFRERCSLAGETTVFIGLVGEYRRRLAWLRAAGEDTTAEQDALDTALSQPTIVTSAVEGGRQV